MDKCIDLYSRLIIATITFVVPVIINLLATFAAGEKRRKELAASDEESLSKQTAQEIQDNPHRVRETVAETHALFVQNDKRIKNEINLLNPISQFWKIVSCLAPCFILLMINYQTSAQYPSFAFIILNASAICYFGALYFIIRILYTITKTKKIVES